MSRTWERKVQRNTRQLNNRLKKQGKKALATGIGQPVKFRGIGYMVPLILLLINGFFIYFSKPWETDPGALFWWTVAAYVVLAAVYLLRRPFLTVTRHTLETRRFTGYKVLKAQEIRRIVLLPKAVVVEAVSGTRWVFSRPLNLYPIEKMSDRLRKFAEDNRVDLEDKTR